MHTSRTRPTAGSIHLDNLSHDEYWAFYEIVCYVANNCSGFPPPEVSVALAKDLKAMLGSKGTPESQIK